MRTLAAAALVIGAAVGLAGYRHVVAETDGGVPSAEALPSSSGAGVPDWDDLVAVVTSTDQGSQGPTYRWDQPVVTYRLELGGYPARYQRLVRKAFAYGADRTGVRVVEVTGDADIDVTTQDGNGARVEAWPRDDGSIDHVHLQLGCCRARPVWEDVLQSFGPLGDRAPSGLFSDNITSATRPGPFEDCVLAVLYRFPPGTTAARLHAVPLDERCA